MSRLKHLSALFNSLYVESEENIQQPVFIIMKDTMPLYRKIAEIYCDNLEVMLVSAQPHLKVDTIQIPKFIGFKHFTKIRHYNFERWL